jgi:hypothetical protein
VATENDEVFLEIQVFYRRQGTLGAFRSTATVAELTAAASWISIEPTWRLKSAPVWKNADRVSFRRSFRSKAMEAGTPA